MVQRRVFESFASWTDAMTGSVEQHLRNVQRMLRMVPDQEQFLERYIALSAHENFEICNTRDAFSQGQIASKKWLIDSCIHLGLSLGQTWTLCGWVGVLGYLLLMHRDQLKISSVRSFDLDPACAGMADTLNRVYVKNGWQFKASTLNVNCLTYDNCQYQTVKHNGTQQTVQESADTVINTSCDHMTEDRTWWNAIPGGRLVILQNNDWHDNDQHTNTVQTLEQFAQQYDMSQLLYKGQLDCTLYQRFMLIGRK